MKSKPISKRGIPSVVKKLKNKLFIVDFCNLKGFSHEKILNLQKKYNVFHTIDGRDRGYNVECIPKHSQERKYWLLIEDEDAIKLKSDFENLFVLPSEDTEEDLFKILRISQKKYKDFIDKCVQEDFDLNFLLNIMEDLKAGLTIKSKKDWEVNMQPKDLRLQSFESHIDWQILNLFLHGMGEIFKHVQICDWKDCGKYFLSSHGTKHCSTICANNKTSYKYRHTPHGRKKHREYMRDHSFSGVYVKKENIKPK